MSPRVGKIAHPGVKVKRKLYVMSEQQAEEAIGPSSIWPLRANLRRRRRRTRHTLALSHAPHSLTHHLQTKFN